MASTKLPQSILNKYLRKTRQNIQYGTAGFRTKADDLDHVLFRMGLLAALRSRVKAAAIGVMITASHNPEPDNGVKLVDPHGEMLEADWETIATELANVEDDALARQVDRIIEQFQIDLDKNASVFIGRDTRPSSKSLSDAAVAGVEALHGEATDFGVVTTPMLHYFVTCHNTGGAYGRPTEKGYYDKLASAFIALRGSQPSDVESRYTADLEFDGANGVGALKMQELMKYLSEKSASLQIDAELRVSVHNSDTTTGGKLNFQCGADHVKTSQAPPSGVPLRPFARCASVDGDADRLVYYYVDEHNAFRLLDGDRIATLLAGYLKDLVEESNLSLDIGLVQTAYANGASTDYIANKLRVPVACVATGVKHLHKKALEFDIGVYFEANGHGTVVFSADAKRRIKKATKVQERGDGGDVCRSSAAAERLAHVVDLTNETVGDALSDLLLVETVLRARGWDAADWTRAYADWPNTLAKVCVRDRNVITTTDAERKVASPAGLQERIDQLVAGYDRARAFVRPSGTEDVVRVFAEASTQDDAKSLSKEVCQAVFELAGGIA